MIGTPLNVAYHQNLTGMIITMLILNLSVVSVDCPRWWIIWTNCCCRILEALRFMHERNVVYLDLKVGRTGFLFSISNWATEVPFSLTMNLSSPFSCCISNLRPHPHVSGHFGNGDFFLRFSLNGVFGQRKYRFPNTAPRVEVFENANFSFTCADGLKRGFLNSLWSYIHTTSMPILCKGCHRRAFSYGRAKTIQILSTARVDTFVWKRNVKFFVF